MRLYILNVQFQNWKLEIMILLYFIIVKNFLTNVLVINFVLLYVFFTTTSVAKKILKYFYLLSYTYNMIDVKDSYYVHNRIILNIL